VGTTKSPNPGNNFWVWILKSVVTGVIILVFIWLLPFFGFQITQIEFQGFKISRATATPKASYSPTPTPHETPTSPTTNPTASAPPTPGRACFDAQTWQSIPPAAPSGNCLDLAPYGILYNGASLQITHTAPQQTETAGICTPVAVDAAIQFTVRLSDLYAISADDVALLSFAISANTPALDSSAARFNFRVDEPGEDPAPRFFLADPGELNGTPIGGQSLQYGYTYQIALNQSAGFLAIKIDEKEISEQITLPGGLKFFCIGYTLPPLAGIAAEISNLTINGNTP
jgi:hypothetical protein